MISYFKNQLDLSNALIFIIDKYWALQINEADFITYINQVAENNKEMLFKNNGYTTIVKQKLGIKRLSLLEKILKTESRQ